jgi:S-adenosylmethionine-diacylglycerol 3-amino-3-carboxypropyl transferase
MGITDWINQNFFHAIHRSSLVYAACWEDPRVDRAALKIGAGDRILVITSAGCNALEYLLDDPAQVYAVDINFRQNALLELKKASIRELDYEDFFQWFGKGYHSEAKTIYRQKLRSHLTDDQRQYWDRAIRLFTNARRSFYFNGSSGTFAWTMNLYIKYVARLYEPLLRMLNANSIHEQWKIYDQELRAGFWKPYVKWGLANPGLLAISGVPRPQVLLARRSPETISQHMQRCTEYCITQQSLADNYFWRLYLTGEFTPDCCPEYLKLNSFQRLKSGLVERVSTHTQSVTSFLGHVQYPISRYALLDHFDWYYGTGEKELAAEWQAILNRSPVGARILWRSMGKDVDFVNQTKVNYLGSERTVDEIVRYDEPLAQELFAKERTRTYQSLRIATLVEV